MEDARSDADHWGIDPDLLSEGSDRDGIWSQHVPALEAFLAIDTQWRVVGVHGGIEVVGLDYAAVRDGLAMAGLDLDADTWAELQLIEAGAVAAMNEDRR